MGYIPGMSDHLIQGILIEGTVFGVIVLGKVERRNLMTEEKEINKKRTV